MMRFVLPSVKSTVRWLRGLRIVPVLPRPCGAGRFSWCPWPTNILSMRSLSTSIPWLFWAFAWADSSSYSTWQQEESSG